MSDHGSPAYDKYSKRDTKISSLSSLLFGGAHSGAHHKSKAPSSLKTQLARCSLVSLLILTVGLFILYECLTYNDEFKVVSRKDRNKGTNPIPNLTLTLSLTLTLILTLTLNLSLI
jgi:hypothetical protein